MSKIVRVWKTNPLNHKPLNGLCDHPDTIMDLLGTVPCIINNIQVNGVIPENVFASMSEQYGYPINKFDGVIDGGIYKPNNGSNVEDPDPDLYPLACYEDAAGGKYYVYLYSIVGYVAPKGQVSCNFVTRLD